MNHLPDDPLLLPRLLVGLEALEEKWQAHDFYPLPPALSVAWNAVTLGLLARGKTAPASLTGLLTLCSRPVGEWFPASLPADFPADGRLLHSGGGIELTGVASVYLSETIYRNQAVQSLADAAQTERFLQNNLFVEQLQRLRNAPNTERAQRDYVLLRRFLITRPFATTEEIRSAFALTSIKPSIVGQFYRDCAPSETYYSCAHCGPLRREGGRWRGAKPEVCSDHRELVPHAVPYRDGLRHLCAAIHERVCLHGIEEARWLDAVHALQTTEGDSSNQLTEVEDWPDIDIVDLRVTFAGGAVWVADMKEYSDPDRLGKEITPLTPAPDSPPYDRAFYVIPDRREDRTPGYCRRVQRAAQLPPNHQILTVAHFLQEVEQQMRRRPRAKKQTAKETQP